MALGRKPYEVKKRGRKAAKAETPAPAKTPPPVKTRKPRKDRSLKLPSGVKRVVITHGNLEYHAHIAGHSRWCGYGDSADEALGKLVREHGAKLDLELENL